MIEMSVLEQIEITAGKLLRYDGRYCLWTTTGTYDIRDVLRRTATAISLADAMEALNAATEEESKRIKDERIAAKEKAEQS